MYWFLSLLFAGLRPAQSDCFYVNCLELNKGVCAENKSQADVSINSSGCGDGFCSYEMVSSWLDTMPRSQQLLCTATSTLQSARVGDTNCPTRQTKKDFASGDTLVQCTKPTQKDEACILQDGSYAPCVCGFDRKSYCVPDISSSVFDDYWAECFKSGVNYGRISDDDHYWFWYYKINYFLPYLTSYSCARKLFEEFTKIDDLMYTSSAATLAISILTAVLS